MKYILTCVLVLGGLCAVPRCAIAIGIDVNGNVSGFYGLAEEDSRFFPGTYFFHKGCEAYARGDPRAAIELWAVAASWGQKSAQYNLGIAHYRGQGVARDAAQGLAWLGLAAERHDPLFQDSLDAAWYEASVEDRIEAKKRHAELKIRFGDDVALVRALRRYEEEKRNFTGSRLGAVGNLTIYSGGNRVGKNGALHVGELEQKADTYFNRSGIVNVGDLIPLTGESGKLPDPG